MRASRPHATSPRRSAACSRVISASSDPGGDGASVPGTGSGEAGLGLGRGLGLGPALGLGLGAFLFYASGLEGRLGWFDAAEFVNTAVLMDLPHPPGYPLQNLLNMVFVRIWPGSDVMAVSLVSTMLCALMVVLIGVLLLRLTGEPLAAGVGVLAFGGAGRIVGLARTPEVYPLELVGVLGILLWCHPRREEDLAADLDGASTGTGSALGFWVLAGLLVAHRITNIVFIGALALTHPGLKPRWPDVLGFFLGWIPHLFTLWVFFLRQAPEGVPWSLNYFDYPRDGITLLKILTGSLYASNLAWPGVEGLLRELAAYAVLAKDQVGLLIAGLGIWGLARSGEWNPLRNPLRILVATNLVVFLGYNALEKDTMYLPSILGLVILGTVTLSRGLAPFQRGRSLVLGVFALGLAFAVGRDEMERRSRYRPCDAQVLLRTLERLLPPGALLVLSHDLLIHPVYHQRFMDRIREDLTLTVIETYDANVAGTIRKSLAAGRAVYTPLLLPEEAVARIRQEFVAVPEGPFYRLMTPAEGLAPRPPRVRDRVLEDGTTVGIGWTHPAPPLREGDPVRVRVTWPGVGLRGLVLTLRGEGFEWSRIFEEIQVPRPPDPSGDRTEDYVLVLPRIPEGRPLALSLEFGIIPNLDEAVSQGTVQRIEPGSSDPDYFLGLAGVFLESIEAGEPAHRVRYRPIGLETPRHEITTLKLAGPYP